jgi:DNA-binding PadR family transcriptional regulator
MWRDFSTGDQRLSPIQVLILLQLKKQSMYGYDILKSLRERFGDTWEPKTGTVYPALRSLETRGFVQTELKEEKEFYSLTEKGEEILKDAGGLLEGNLEFAGKYYRFLPPLNRDRIMEKMIERFSQGHEPPFPPFFPIFPPNELDDKETRIKHLKMIREITQRWLQTIDGEINKLESQSGEPRRSENP